MHRLLILIAIPLCFVCGLMAPAVFAADYCPSVTVADTQYCECIVHNYATTADANVTITVFNNGAVARTCGPLTIAAGGDFYCDIQFTSFGLCACKVTGEGLLIRTSLCVDPGDFNPLVCVPCK
jgi:hypothetical protein